MTVPNPHIKFTYEDYVNAPEDKRYELLDGELLMTPAPAESAISASLFCSAWKLLSIRY